ncbi:ABC transporter permease [Sporanaerobium hydrogeniformans]|uniref:ABC transporter permease n=1 Tax=Sporanaerobium hydrogeniformans TaxID=3072179 RepID=A0AC61DEF0_9FIRM|nr:sugar ABC transporter permease [Sporanaerobium hydrogeniformans]PHV71198.1 ABC transporter permease [Sporanaerobium hydrogeniformans]
MNVGRNTVKEPVKISKEYKVNQFKKGVFISAFASVPVALLITFSYIPLCNMFYYSFTSWDGLAKTKKLIGFSNYITIFSNPEYFMVFKTSLYYLVGAFIQMAIALYFATLLTNKVKGGNFFKGILFFPNLINGVAIGMVFLCFFQVGGTLDMVLKALGLQDWIHKWLGDRSINNMTLAATSIWRYMGFNMVIFVGAIQSISSEIYEAAELDGANRWQQFRYIIMPSIKRIIQLNLLLAINGALAVFEIPYIMTDGNNGTATFVIQTIDTAFKYKKVGLASAMGMVLFIIVILVAIIQTLFLNDKREERL